MLLDHNINAAVYGERRKNFSYLNDVQKNYKKHIYYIPTYTYNKKSG